MKVRTQTDRANTARRMVMELLLTDQPPKDVAHDPESEFWKTVGRAQLAGSRFPRRAATAPDRSHPAMAVNLDACIQCNLCVRACREVQVNDVIGMAYRNHGSKIVFDFDDPMGESTCVACGECVQACPTGALSDDPDRPLLRFTEDACVQCGLCKATCPEKVISLRPRLAFGDVTVAARVLKKEEPFPCIRCGKPFGVKSTIDRVVAKLEGKHWMYQNSPSRLDVIKMCDDCRVAVVTEEGFDPYGAPPRPKPRTTDDYLRERESESES